MKRTYQKYIEAQIAEANRQQRKKENRDAMVMLFILLIHPFIMWGKKIIN